MKKRASILINALLILTFSSIVFISMARKNDQVHKFETIVFEQELPTTYIDYTLELFYEDMTIYFNSYINDPSTYQPIQFRNLLLDRIDGITGFSYVGDNVESENTTYLTNFGHILNNDGYSITGNDTYTIGISVEGFTGSFDLTLDYEKTWVYFDDFKEHRRLCNTGDQYYCDLTEDPDSWDTLYVFYESSDIVINQTG